jgi:hypothetical protein
LSHHHLRHVLSETTGANGLVKWHWAVVGVVEWWWAQLNVGGRSWMMVAGGGGGDAVVKVGGWERKWLFVDNVFICWMFVNNMFVLNVPRKTIYTGYNWSLFGLANIEIMTNQRPDRGYG